MNETPARVAIVRLSALGDVIHTLPLAVALKRAWPTSQISFVSQPESLPLLDGHPAIDRVVTLPRRSGPIAAIRGLLGLRQLPVDLLIDPQGNSKSAVVSRMIRARRRLGVRLRDAREWTNRLGHRECVAPYESQTHVVRRYLSFAAHLGIEDLSIDFGLKPTDAERADARALLAGLGERVVAMQIGRLDDVRHWPADRYAAVADRLAIDHGYDLVLTAGPAEVDDSAAVASKVAHARLLDTGGQTNLRQLLALYTELAARPSSALLSGDTAPIHLASAAGLPTVGLFGSQPAWRTGPLAPRSVALSREGALSCVPCRKRVCHLREEPRACMNRITVDEVVAAIVGRSSEVAG